MSDISLLELTAAEAAAAIAAGSLGAHELVEAYRARATADREAGEEGLNCFTWVAQESHPASGQPLGGVPFAAKDLFCTADAPSQSGSRILEGYEPPYTATAVRRLTEAGASMIAKTNQD
ncbi:MAG: amidase family protein, partial [Solirubrobacteraceae bacterium]